MSAFIGLLKRNKVYVATDTLVSILYRPGDTEVVPFYFTSKTFHLPQFKSIFASTGIQDVGLAFHQHLTDQNFFGLDVNSIIRFDLEPYKEALRRKYHPIKPHGTIFLYGLDIQSMEFKGYWLPVNKGVNQDEPMTWRPFDYAKKDTEVVLTPRFDGCYERIKWKGNEDVFEQMSELMKDQKKEDEKRKIEDRVGIGGEVIITEMRLDSKKNLVISSHVYFTFPDYIQQARKMLTPDK